MPSIKEVIQQRSEFVEEFQVDHRPELALLEEVFQLGESMAKRLSSDPTKDTLYHALLALALIRTVNRLDSILILLRVGNPIEGAIILRSIFEGLINLDYMNKAPEVRSLLFRRQEISDILKFQRRQANRELRGQCTFAVGIQESERKVSEYDSEIKRISPDFRIPKGKDWSGKNIREMAEEVGLLEAYDIMYWELSGITHSLATSSKYFVRTGEGKRLYPIFYPHEASSKWVAEFAALHSLFILKTVDENIGFGRERAINQLKKRIERTYPKKQN